MAGANLIKDLEAISQDDLQESRLLIGEKRSAGNTYEGKALEYHTLREALIKQPIYSTIWRDYHDGTRSENADITVALSSGTEYTVDLNNLGLHDDYFTNLPTSTAITIRSKTTEWVGSITAKSLSNSDADAALTVDFSTVGNPFTDDERLEIEIAYVYSAGGSGGGGGGGLTESEVDARIADWAETGNTDVVPQSKIPFDIAKTKLQNILATVDEFNHGADTTKAPTVDQVDRIKVSEIPDHLDPTATTAGTITAEHLAEAISARGYDHIVTRTYGGTNGTPTQAQYLLRADGTSTVNYHLEIRQGTGINQLPDEYLTGLPQGQKIELQQGTDRRIGTVNGRVNYEADQTNWVIPINFPNGMSTRTGSSYIKFGYSPVILTEPELLWRYVTDFTEGAGSSNTNRTLISGMSFDDYTHVYFWYTHRDDEDSRGVFESVPIRLWEDISTGLGDDTVGHILLSYDGRNMGVRWQSATTFSIPFVDYLRLRAIFGIRG